MKNTQAAIDKLYRQRAKVDKQYRKAILTAFYGIFESDRRYLEVERLKDEQRQAFNAINIQIASLCEPIITRREGVFPVIYDWECGPLCGTIVFEAATLQMKYVKGPQGRWTAKYVTRECSAATPEEALEALLGWLGVKHAK